MKIKDRFKQVPYLSKARQKLPLVSGIVIAATFIGILAGGDGFAAQDGSLGRSSTGSIKISITIPAMVQIHQLQDIQATLDQADSINQANTKLPAVDACVYSTSGAYTLDASNNNGSANGSAVLRGSQHQLPYHLNVADNHSSRYTDMLAGNNKVQMRGASDPECADGKNLHIQMQLANNAQLSPDSYSDVVNFTVSPV